MKVIKELKEAHKRLSKVNVDFIEFVEKNPGSLKRSGFNLLELNDELFKLQPWPTFINRENKKEFRHASVKLFDLIKGVPRRLFDNDPSRISKYFGIPPDRVKHQLEGVDDEHIDSLLARGDFILSDSFGLKCLEYNVSACLGGWDLPIWESLYLNTPLIAKFFKEYRIKINNGNLYSISLAHILGSALGKFSDEDGEVNIALVTSRFVESARSTAQIYLDQLYKEILQQQSRPLKGGIFMCDFPYLTVGDDCVYYKGKKIHIIVEMYNGAVPPKIMKLFKSGQVSLINGPITGLLSDKLMLALLSDHETSDAFAPREKEIINKYIPWTRKIAPGETRYQGERVNLKSFILSNREKLVIKPSNGYGGQDVYVGGNTSEKEWEQALERAVNRKNWLVQEFVNSSPALYQTGENECGPNYTVWGFFVFGSLYGGGWVRVMPEKENKGVINCHQGATVSVIFEVDE
jgi:hypothetical protein